MSSTITISGLLRPWSKKLHPLFPHKKGYSWIETEILLAHVLKKDREWLIAHGGEGVSGKVQKTFESLAKKRLAHMPMAYLIGSKHFYGHEFIVNQHTLIPRPETEIMIDEVIKLPLLKKDVKSRGDHVPLRERSGEVLLWDVGTGSGAIAISLATHALIRTNKTMTVIASDIDSRALRIAKKNSHQHRAKVKFIQENLLGSKIKSLLRREIKKHLIVVANLPYLPLGDKKVLSPDVVKHEPSQALFTKDKGMFLNKKLLQQIAKWCQVSQTERPDTISIFLEFDPPQAGALKKYAQKLFPKANISIIKDQFKKNRFLKVLVP